MGRRNGVFVGVVVKLLNILYPYLQAFLYRKHPNACVPCDLVWDEL